MKLRAKILMRKIRTRPHMFAWIILGIVTPILFLITIYTLTGRSFEQIERSKIEQVSEINTIAGNISDSDKIGGFTKDYQQTIVSLTRLNDEFDKIDEHNESFMRSLLYPDKSAQLKTKTEEIVRFAKQNKSVSENLAYQFTTLEKFMNYDPVQDFSEYGVDRVGDSERVSRTKVAFTALSKNYRLNKDIIGAIKQTENTLVELEQTSSTQAFYASIDQAKTTIVQSLSSSLVKLKKDVSDFYNLQLYQ